MPYSAAAPRARWAAVLWPCWVRWRSRRCAKADGQIDQREIEHITGKVQAEESSRRRLLEELRQPMDTERIVRAVNNNPQLAAQVYAASLLAINVDTEAERRYLTDLAAKLRLDPAVVQNLHDALGV